MIKAVIFDIDDTLTEKNSWAVSAVALGGTHKEDLAIYHAHKAGQLTDEEADQKILQMWVRNGPVHRDKFEEVFQSIPLRHDAQELVEYLKQQNLTICLITGSMDVYARIIASKLGVENYYSNAVLLFDEAGNIISFSYKVDQGRLKLEQFKEFCNKNNLLPEQCAVIGDSENDRELFAYTKRGIAVRTKVEDKELENLAWKIVNNLSEIKEIIK